LAWHSFVGTALVFYSINEIIKNIKGDIKLINILFDYIKECAKKDI